MSQFRLLALFACTFLAACQLDFGADIPCEADGDCPAEQVCNLDFFRCVDGEATDTDLDGSGGDDVGDVSDDVADIGDVSDDVSDADVPDAIEDVLDADDADDAQDGSGDADDVGDDVDEDTGDVDPGDVPDGDDACVFEGDEVCDGVDNDCNGVIDDPPVCGVSACGAGMTLVNRSSGTRFCIDTYEASRQDATATDPGVDNTIATSRPDVLPWSNASFANATSACANAEKRVCTSFEWQTACFGDTSDPYPYGRVYGGDVCNGVNTPPLDGPAPTGSFEECLSRDGVLDMSGNLREWTRSTSGSGNELFGGSFAEPQLNLRCSSRETDTSGTALPNYGFRCCAVAPE